MPNFIVIGFYTADTPYEKEIKQLVRSCQAFGIHCHTESYTSRGSWVRNAAIKPEFILKMMESHPDKNIVYLDADARIKKYPKLFDTLDADIAIHFRNGKELLSGTIFIGAKAKSLIQAWAEAQQKQIDTWDQKVLAEVLKTWRKPIRIVRLPPTYCQIFDTMRNAGDPVIEHLQASRRYKQLVTIGTTRDIPHVLYNMKIRSAVDGSYWISKRHKQVEAFMDANCIRFPGSLRWSPRYTTTNRFNDLKEIFKDQRCYIIGKGPSLDHLGVRHFPNTKAPIIAINEAIFKVESLELSNPIYALQQDAKLRSTCLPKRAPIFISMKAANYYAGYERVYIFQNTELGLHPNALSVSAAICLAKRLGSIEFELICFDACVNQRLGYARCITYKSTWGGAPKRFLTHRSKIMKHAQHTPVEWTIPEVPV